MGEDENKVRGDRTKANSGRGLKGVIRETTKLWRKHHLSYDQSRYVVERVRRELKLEKPKARRRTVARLDRFEVERLIEAAYRKGSRYGLMIKTLFYTGARVSEFVNIKVEDLHLNLAPPQIYLAVAKAGSDGFVPILPTLAQELRTYLSGRKTVYLFESNRRARLLPTRRAAHRARCCQAGWNQESCNPPSAQGQRRHAPFGRRHVP